MKRITFCGSEHCDSLFRMKIKDIAYERCNSTVSEYSNRPKDKVVVRAFKLEELIENYQQQVKEVLEHEYTSEDLLEIYPWFNERLNNLM